MKKFTGQFENIGSSGEKEKGKSGGAPPEAPSSEKHASKERPPIEETPTHISYLGVELPKAEKSGGEAVPSREKYADYINDPFSLELQKKIAISFANGDPILIEGGTSIGKTTTVRKMAAELGWEVHYVDLNSDTDVENLMGRYIPNVHRSEPDDPEYVFADGRVTSGLRQEEGKIKVIILDEYNSTSGGITRRLHAVIDALERGGDVVLSEDASESVSVDKARTKIIALINPPGRGFTDREVIDPAQLRRWVYQKEATELPKETFSISTDALFGLAERTQDVPDELFFEARDTALSQEQLAEIPGMPEILAKYKEFHHGAKAMLEARKLAEDQPQPFSYDDRVEPKRVSDFILRFYNGDINETFQQALRYYYAGKLESEEDRAKLEELIANVQYVPPKTSERRGLEREKSSEADEAFAEARRLRAAVEGEAASPELAEQIQRAKELLGKKEVFDHMDVKEVWGVKLSPEEVPDIPFSREDLERAKELGQHLILRLNHDKEGNPLTMQKMLAWQEAAYSDKGGGKLLYSSNGKGGVKEDCWYKNEPFLTEETPSLEWALVSKETLPGSKGKDYLQQTEILVTYLEDSVFRGKTMPKAYKEAIKEFKSKKESIRSVISSDWKKAAEELEKLKITELTRQTPAETLYDIASYFLKNEEKLLEHEYTWTSRRGSDGDLVDLGLADSDGAVVHGWPPVSRIDDVGVSFSRSV